MFYIPKKPQKPVKIAKFPLENEEKSSYKQPEKTQKGLRDLKSFSQAVR